MRTILTAVTACLLFLAAPAATVPATAFRGTAEHSIDKPVKPGQLPTVKDIERITGHQLNFIERVTVKMMLKKMERRIKKGKVKDVDADRLARQAETFGLLALGALLLFPLAALPLGILAITKGSSALANGTELRRKARSGVTMGIISLSLLLIAIFLIVLVLAAFGSW